MKKINKSLPPNPLTVFVNSHPNATWDDFRNNARQSYADLKQKMLAEQGGLCAYCEKKLPNDVTQQRIEHFHNKSDLSPQHNWALDWENVLLVCLGGSTSDDKANYAPDHLSCDAHKEQVKGLPEACEGWYLNPVQIKTVARLFNFDKATGKLLVNCAACQQLANDDLPNQYGSDWCMLAEETIRILNLNCRRLCDDRLEVLKFYNQRMKYYRENQDRSGIQKIVEFVFNKKFPSFFTTWRALLGEHAETYLDKKKYEG